MDIHRESGFPEVFRAEDEVLCELYTQMLKVVRHKLWHKNDAGDVVQEAWVRILEKQSTLRHKEKLIPWAKAIAANLASNANRVRRHERIDDHQELELVGIGSVIEPESMMELSDLLGQLDPVTRTLLLYKFYYGLKDAEIAAALQLPVGTVKARIHRGKARLKTQVNSGDRHT
ncbi:RNA polymerase sigma factor [Cohnella sp.]|uniref:RNA polymerase sigma factor n=1 Tax=Cohnella sp. TaxID=1883426 RepID=UPI003562043C